MFIGEAGIEEPMWVHMSFMKPTQREHWFNQHPIGIHEITGLTLTTSLPLRPAVSQRVIENEILSTLSGAAPLLAN